MGNQELEVIFLVLQSEIGARQYSNGKLRN